MSDFKELKETCKILERYSHPWFFCGGWALDLFVGVKTREHSDIEIGIFRENQLELQTYLQEWKLNWVHGGEKYEWEKGTYLNLPIHEIEALCERTRLEVLLSEEDEKGWIYRRNTEITLPLNKIIQVRDDIPFMCPEVVLLFKSTNVRPKDQQDFESALSQLSVEQKKWLKDCLWQVDNAHDWISYL